MTQHYLWAGGHFLLLLSGFRYFLAWIMFKSVSSWWYKGAQLIAQSSEKLVLIYNSYSELLWRSYVLCHRVPVSAFCVLRQCGCYVLTWRSRVQEGPWGEL